MSIEEEAINEGFKALVSEGMNVYWKSGMGEHDRTEFIGALRMACKVKEDALDIINNPIYMKCKAEEEALTESEIKIEDI